MPPRCGVVVEWCAGVLACKGGGISMAAWEVARWKRLTDLAGSCSGEGWKLRRIAEVVEVVVVVYCVYCQLSVYVCRDGQVGRRKKEDKGAGVTAKCGAHIYYVHRCVHT